MGRGSSRILCPIGLATSSAASAAVPFLTSKITSLDMVEGGDLAGLAGELHEEMDLPVGQPAAHGRPHPGGDVRIHHVQIEGDVHAIEVREVLRNPLDDAVDPVRDHLFYRVGADAGLRQDPPLLPVHAAQPDHDDVLGVHARPRRGPGPGAPGR